MDINKINGPIIRDGTGDFDLLDNTLRRLTKAGCKSHEECIVYLAREIEYYRNKIEMPKKQFKENTSAKTININVYLNKEHDNDR